MVQQWFCDGSEIKSPIQLFRNKYSVMRILANFECALKLQCFFCSDALVAFYLVQRIINNNYSLLEI